MSSSKKTVLIIGTGSLLNYGCEAIVRGSYRILRTFFPDCEIFVASDDKVYDATILPPDIHLVSYKKRFTLYRLFKGVLRRCFNLGKGSPVRMNTTIGKKYDIILSCGGDNFCESPDGKILNLLIDLMRIGETAHLARKKYILWGASVGPFHDMQNMSFVFKNLMQCDLINVREELSYQYLQQDKQVFSNTKLVADPAFCLEADTNVDFCKEVGKIYIGLNISFLSIAHSISPNEIENFKLQLFRQLDSILSSDSRYFFVCIPHVIVSQDSGQNDIVFMNEYIEKSEYKQRISILPPYIGAAKTKGYIQQMDLLIAARMHCCVGGISMATPTLFVTYSNKGIGMSFYAYGHHNFEVKVSELLTSKFMDLITSMLMQKVEIKHYLELQQKRFVQDAMNSGKYLKELFS